MSFRLSRMGKTVKKLYRFLKCVILIRSTGLRPASPSSRGTRLQGRGVTPDRAARWWFG